VSGGGLLSGLPWLKQRWVLPGRSKSKRIFSKNHSLMLLSGKLGGYLNRWKNTIADSLWRKRRKREREIKLLKEDFLKMADKVDDLERLIYNLDLKILLEKEKASEDDDKTTF